jgi:RimJ/RimL family protein N-acetyltransferase
MNAPPPSLHIPDQFESERLVIRCPRPGDGPQLHEAVCETLAALRQFPASMPWSMHAPTQDSALQYCLESEARFIARTDLPLLLFLKQSGRLVGSSGLHRFNWHVPKFEIGYWCRQSCQGQGLITEAARAITAFAFDTLHARRVEALPDDENGASCRVLERAGYQLEGILRHERIDPDGVLRNTRMYACIR